MSEDIVTRLRAFPRFGSQDGDRWYKLGGNDETCSDAADELERLAAQLVEVGKVAIDRGNQLIAAHGEIERLRLELATARYVSLRDHFAGLAMQGFLAWNASGTGGVGEMAYQVADDMLKAKEQR